MKRILFVAVLAAMCVGALHAQVLPVPNPNVIGPIPVTAPPGDQSHNYVFLTPVIDLAAAGYVEEEFFLEGTANRYNTPPLATGSIIDTGHPYRTRMVVRRPVSADAFNGTVLMEWQNDAAGCDADLLWAQSHEHWMAKGYAWIGVSAFRMGVHQPGIGLRAWSPQRYGTLDVTDGGTILNDALMHDIISQAAQAVRHPLGLKPMGGLPVRFMFLMGASKSANNMVPYHNSIQPLHGLFDGFAIILTGTNVRTDLEAKVFKLISETDIANLQAAQRQPDSDHFRRWEVAGTSHVDFHTVQQLAAPQARDLPTVSPPVCGKPRFSRVPMYVVLNAAIDHLTDWVKHGIEPPTAPDIEVSSVGPPATVVRDSFGNARGGIRLAQHAVPTATNTGVNTPASSLECRTSGSHEPFDAATLAMLYPDHRTYLFQSSRSRMKI